MSNIIPVKIDDTIAKSQAQEFMYELMDQSKLVEEHTKKVANNIQKNKINLMSMVSYGLRMTNLILSNLKQTANVQRALLGVQVTTTAISIAQTIKQAAAAFATGNIIEGGLLTTIAASMNYNLIKTTAAQTAAIANEEYINSINLQMERYS